MLRDNNGRREVPTHSSKTRKPSQAHSLLSACSSASSVRSAINRAESTISALKYLDRSRLEDVEETASVTSSYWDTDLEDNLSDEEMKKEGVDETNIEQEMYLKVCDKLGVVPVTRFGDQIGQEEVKVR